MKKVKHIIIMSFFFFNLFLFSQDKEASYSDFNFMYRGKPLDINDDYFKQKKFLFGYQWSGPGLMYDSLLMNSKAANRPVNRMKCDTITRSNKPLLIVQPGQEATAAKFPYIRNAASMLYEPCMKITEENKLIAYQNCLSDDMQPIFGFRNIHNEAIPKLFANRWRLFLKKDKIQTGETILSGVWPNDQLLSYNGKGQHKGYNVSGRFWNITINLRSMDTTTIPENDTLPVLKIRMFCV